MSISLIFQLKSIKFFAVSSCINSVQFVLMALINIDTAIKRAVQKLKKLSPPEGIEILTYKRNRGVSILKMGEDLLSVRERGYEVNEFSVSFDDLPKLLKSISKREFPRSRKVRIYQLASPEEEGQDRKKL